MDNLPAVAGLSWSKIRALARGVAADEPVEVILAAVPGLLSAAEPAERQFGAYLLGFTCAGNPEQLELLRRQAGSDPSWEVQEAVAQAFDGYCGGVGYEHALPTIDAWLADEHPNVRRAVSEGLRPWTAGARRYFAARPTEAIRRLAGLRADPSDYTRHSAGNALRDIRRRWPELVDAETRTWDLNDPLQAFTYRRVLRAR